MVPVVFSPNGDGVNDLFTITGYNVDEVTGYIYNRWGELIYEWVNVADGWDGSSFSGEPAREGTYFYVFTVRGQDEVIHEKTGSVTLVR